MIYKDIWWQTTDEDGERLEDEMKKHVGWEIFQMFLVFGYLPAINLGFVKYIDIKKKK